MLDKAQAAFDIGASMVHHAGDAVVVVDPAGRVTVWNEAGETMFGRSSREVLGATLDLIIPHNLRDRHWTGFRQTLATGDTQYAGRTLAVPALRADGTRISIEFTVSLLRDERDELVGIGAIIRDVTTRWEEQRALKRRVAELETELATLRR